VPFLKNVLGLDLGSHTIKAVELAQGLRTVEVVRLHAEPRDPELSLANQVTRMLSIQSFRRDNVVAALRGDRISVRRLSFPFAEKRRVAQAVPFELEDQVPFDIADMVTDWQLVEREGTQSHVVSVLAPRTEVSALIETLHQARCDARIIESEGLVLANLASSFEFPGTRLLVDIGHAKTAICAVRSGKPVAARSIGIAGRSFTEAVAQERLLSLEQAERWKHERGVAEPASDRRSRAPMRCSAGSPTSSCASRSRSRRSCRRGSEGSSCSAAARSSTGSTAGSPSAPACRPNGSDCRVRTPASTRSWTARRSCSPPRSRSRCAGPRARPRA
jgi:Tfp pilus assembly PilM family ATPase